MWDGGRSRYEKATADLKEEVKELGLLKVSQSPVKRISVQLLFGVHAVKPCDVRVFLYLKGVGRACLRCGFRW